MDKKIIERLAALRAKASADPKGIDSIVDSVSDDDAFIQKVVEKIMSKMDAQDGAGKYSVDAHATNKKQAALDRAIALLKMAFDDPGAPASMPPAPDPSGMSPMDSLFGETPGGEAVESKMPELAPVQKLEDEATKFGDPALDALVNVIELLIKKDMGNKLPEEAAPAGPTAPMANDAPPSDPMADDAGDSKPPFGGESSKPKSDDKKEDKDGGDDKKPPFAKKSEGDDDDSKDDESDDEAPADDEKKSVEARLQALVSLPKEERLARAAQLRKLAEVAESGELPAFMKKDKDDEDDEEMMDKEAMKVVLRAALAALEAGENDKKYTDGASPEEHAEKADELEKEAAQSDRKSKVLAHLAKLRLQKQATVDGKSMSTPKEVPSPEGTVDDQLSGDAKIQYSPNTADRALSTIETKKQKLPSDQSHGDEAVMYAGNNPEAIREVQTEKDSTKGATNKRVLKDMGTAVQPDHPVSPTEEMEMGAGSHQKEKDWEKAKSESDTTPSGPRLVGLASETDRAVRALKLARVAQAKGMIATDDQFDELVTRYASYDNAKFAMAVEVVNETPARTASRVVKAQEAVFEDNNAMEENADMEEGAPKAKEASLLASAKQKAEALGIRPSAGLNRPIVSVADGGNVMGVRPPMPQVRNERFAVLADPDMFNWKGVTTAFLEAERNGTLDQKTQRTSQEL